MMAGYIQSSKTVEWSSPSWLVDYWAEIEGPFTFDPCATAENAVAGDFLTIDDDGLKSPWKGKVWLNPPYGRGLNDWMAKANQELESGRVESIVALLPSRTDTRWFHDHILSLGHEIHFLKGRIAYGNGGSRAPFASIIVVMKGGSE